MRCNVKHIK
ncbi:predicted protein [Fibroporia radiculosa]|uniref:Uncharacterized protein n=1 Tax=Fibroporia radiculosa TaxID=599839 RepID=J4ICR3_9APHY|nr:predicted protein [Fibroporia radiculosa]